MEFLGEKSIKILLRMNTSIGIMMIYNKIPVSATAVTVTAVALT